MGRGASTLAGTLRAVATSRQLRVWRLLLEGSLTEERAPQPFDPYVTLTGSVYSSSARGDFRRELFTVEGVRVSFDGERWECGCSDCASGSTCTHIEQARRFRHIRCTRELAQPIQLAFDEPGFGAAPTDHAVEHQPFAHSSPQRSAGGALLTMARSAGHHGRSGAVMAAAATAGVCFALIAYLSVEPSPVIATVAVASPRLHAIELRPAASLPAAPTVKVVNPFDPSETFEFPPGTSDAEAQDSAAALLLERARQRLAGAPERGHAR